MTRGEEHLEIAACRCDVLRMIHHVLGGGHRLEVICSLALRSQPVQSIAAHLSLDVTSVSKDLAVLLQHGLVVLRPYKRQRWYSLSSTVGMGFTDDHIYLHVKTGRSGDLIMRVPLFERIEPRGEIAHDQRLPIIETFSRRRVSQQQSEESKRR